MKFDIFLPFPEKSYAVVPAVPYYDDLSVHAEMLSDKVRMSTFEKAIKRVVQGKVVLDIGAGTLILSMLASKHGAKRVYSIEVSSYLFSLYEKLLKENNMIEKVIPIRSNSTEVELPERCDVLISEIIGHFGIDEGIIPVFEDAKKRLLKKSPIIIPNSISLYLMPVEIPEFENEFINRIRNCYKSFELSYSLDEEMHYRASYLIEHPEELNLWNRAISNPKNLAFFDLTNKNRLNFSKDLEFIVKRDSWLNGFVGWFRANLIDNISICTSPRYKKTHWKQCFFPIESLKVKKGCKVETKVEYQENNPFKIKWRVKL